MFRPHNNALLLNMTPAVCVDMELGLGRPGMAKFALKGQEPCLHFCYFTFNICLSSFTGKRECQHFEAVHCQRLQNSIVFLQINLGTVWFSSITSSRNVCQPLSLLRSVASFSHLKTSSHTLNPALQRRLIVRESVCFFCSPIALVRFFFFFP